MILLDASGVLAWLDDREPDHEATVAAMEGIEGPFLLSPLVLNELDYLVGTRMGVDAQREFLREVEDEAFDLEPFTVLDVRAACSIIDRYQALGVSLADASIVVLAERHGTRDVLTLDQRHFRTLPGPAGKPFRLLPADA